MAHAPQCAGSRVVSTQAPPHAVGVGAAQPLAQAPLAHTGVAPEHPRPHVPHVEAVARSASQPLVAALSQSANPATHRKPHAAPSHVATAFAGAEHGVQLAPHEASEVFATHTSPQRWKPARHTKPQLDPSQVASAFGGGAHGEHAAPQLAGAASATHASPQR